MFDVSLKTDGTSMYSLLYETKQHIKGTSSPAVEERPRDASCLSVVSFNRLAIR